MISTTLEDMYEQERHLSTIFPKQSPLKNGWVYFITGNIPKENCIKIGWSSTDTIYRRLWTHYLQTYDKSRFLIFGAVRGTINTENSIHYRFSRFKLAQEVFQNKNNEILLWLYRNMPGEHFETLCNTIKIRNELYTHVSFPITTITTTQDLYQNKT